MSAARPTFSDLILLRAVQRLEPEGQALDDVVALREAHAEFQQPAARLIARASMLAREHGLTHALTQWRARLPWLALGAALLVGLLSYGLVNAVVGHDRQINAVAALLAVLGPHALSLLLWLAGLMAGGNASGITGWAAQALSRGLGPSRVVLAATLDVLGRQRGLAAWAFGVLNHAIWSLALLLTLAGLSFAFSFLAYRLTWETTILAPGFFAAFAKLSGWLPGLLGFPTPDVTGNDNRGWALWLMGCTLVYGLALRLCVLGLSVLRTRQLLRGLTLDTSDPYLRHLMTRFTSLDATSELLDVERPGAARAAPGLGGNAAWQGQAVVGFELPEVLPWPAALAAVPQARTDGSAVDKRAVLARLTEAAPAHLLLLCHGPSSPDRGAERFVRAALQTSGSTAMLLMAADAADLRRWRDWVAETGLPLHAVFDHAEAAQQWLAHND